MTQNVHEFARHTLIDGEIVPADKAQVSLFSSALISSFGVYESVQIEDGVPFHLWGHVERLFSSADIIDLHIPTSREEVAEWTMKLVEADHYDASLLRIIALGSTHRGERATVCILPYPLPHYPAESYTKGAAVTTYEGVRPLPRCKSLNTLVSFIARRTAQKQGALEGLLVSDGRFTEGARSNIFAVRGRVLITPPATEVISGITRDIVIKLAMEAGFTVREERLPVADVPHFEEMFITSTSMHVVPVVRLDDTPIGDGRIGEVTADLHDRFEEYYREYKESYTPDALPR